MRLYKIHLKGFRNFDDAEISLQGKTLIIGANDVGKTNLIYALRLLFDKTITDHDLELSDSDYNAYSGTDQIEITVFLDEITEECLLSEFGGSIKDGKLIIRYTNRKGGSYNFFAGFDENTLTELATRKYIRRLNLQYVDTNRDLTTFLSRERIRILQIAKEKLSSEKVASDQQTIESIQASLNAINQSISSLNYISTSLEEVNRELGKLSIHNEDQSIQFVAGDSDAGKMLDKLSLSYSTGTKPLTVGGDGRNNQIFLATWIAKQHFQDSVDHVTFYAIEEPEAHLHPHQQRRLSAYIQNSFSSQILVTSHSPHIASQFESLSIVRLYSENKYTYAASGGCSEVLKRAFIDFGYRLNSLSAEVFFSDGVFLVEGVSEVLLFNALSDKIGIDLDRLNITILSVEGIGFMPYVAVCNALNIPWVIRTDNDIFTKNKDGQSLRYYASNSRVMHLISAIGDNETGLLQYWNEHEKDNEWNSCGDIPESASALNNYVRNKACDLGIYVADYDLENDLANSELRESLLGYYGETDLLKLVKLMQRKKAENMMAYISDCGDDLEKLESSSISSPIRKIADMVKRRVRPYDKSAD